MNNSYQDIILIELQKYFHPLMMFGNTEDEIIALFNENGWSIKGVLGTNITGFLTTIGTVKTGIQTIQDIVENPPETISEFIEALKHIPPIVEAITAIAQTVDDLKRNGNGGAIATVDLAELQKMPLDLMNYLTIRYLFFHHIRIYRSLELFGIIQYELQEVLQDDNGKLIRGGRKIPKLRFDKISDLFTDPSTHFTNLYELDFSDEEKTADGGYRLFRNIAQLLITFGIEPDLLASDLTDPPTTTLEYQKKGSMVLSKEFFNYDENTQTATQFEFGALFRLLSNAAPSKAGLYIEPFGDLDIETILGNWKLGLKATSSVGAIEITKSGINITLPDNGGSLTDFKIGLDLTKLGDPDLGNQALLIGSTTGTRFEIKEISFGSSFEILDTSNIDNLEYGGRLTLKEAAFVIQGGDGDGFLSKILPEEGLRLAFEMGLEWTNKKGFRFTFGISSGTALELLIPLNQTLFNVIDFKDVRFRLAGEPGNKGLATSIGGSIGLSIGPFNAMIENMGMKAVFNLPESGGGNLGPLDLDFGFKPPSGIGMSIDAGGFKGGGFLSFDEPRYVGALQLTFASGFNISAVCIITTKLPGGEEGFSLLVVITVEFSPGIQVGMGLSITGFGGILALHRSIDTDVIRSGLKTGMLESILFPQDILNNPEKIISDLDTAFPIVKDHFVFGPMLKGAWGDKSLVSISVGLMIELPDPRIMLPGLLGISLLDTDGDDNDETFKVLDINIAFVGILDIPGKMISIDASIYNSKILTMVIEGDMAFRLTWGDNPIFVLSMGGFHPSFTPPPLGLSKMNRLSLIIFNNDIIKLYAKCYMAITSNTFQFGAEITFFLDFKIIAIDCFFSLDTIFFFNPFNMEVGIVMRGAVLFFGQPLLSLSASATLSGPSPWHIYGNVTVNIANLIDFDQDFDEKFGKEIPATTPTIELRSILRESLLDANNWKPINGSGQHELVTFGEGPQDTLLIRPMGSLEISQNKMPLAFDMEKFGTYGISGPNRFEIETVKVNGKGISIKNIEDFFAPMEFQTIEDNTAAVEADAYEKYTSGIRISSTTIRTGTKKVKPVTHELALIDVAIENPIVSSTSNTNTTVSTVSQQLQSASRSHSTNNQQLGTPYNSEVSRQLELKGNAISRSELSRQSPVATAKAKTGIKVRQQKYALVDAKTLHLLDTNNYNYREAKMKLKEVMRNYPNLNNEVKIVPINKQPQTSTVVSASTLSKQMKTKDNLLNPVL